MPSDRSPAQLLTLLIGATFILVGILGFIPGITSHLYGGLDFAGHNSKAELFHVFQVIDQAGGANFVPFNTADNWLHFALGTGMIVLGFATTRGRELAPAA
jgi:hypothetical protein